MEKKIILESENFPANVKLPFLLNDEFLAIDKITFQFYINSNFLKVLRQTLLLNLKRSEIVPKNKMNEINETSETNEFLSIAINIISTRTSRSKLNLKSNSEDDDLDAFKDLRLVQATINTGKDLNIYVSEIISNIILEKLERKLILLYNIKYFKILSKEYYFEFVSKIDLREKIHQNSKKILFMFFRIYFYNHFTLDKKKLIEKFEYYQKDLDDYDDYEYYDFDNLNLPIKPIKKNNKNKELFDDLYSGNTCSICSKSNRVTKLVSFKIYDKEKKFKNNSEFNILRFEITKFENARDFDPLEVLLKIISMSYRFNTNCKNRRLISESQKVLKMLRNATKKVHD